MAAIRPIYDISEDTYLCEEKEPTLYKFYDKPEDLFEHCYKHNDLIEGLPKQIVQEGMKREMLHLDHFKVFFS